MTISLNCNMKEHPDTLKLRAWRSRAACVVAGVLLAGSLAARAGTTLFLDNFNGLALSPLWVTRLPNAPVAKGDYQNESYVGAPDYGFAKLGGASVLRMNTVLQPLQRAGWSLNTNFHSADFRYEVRFNTLVQSATNSIDGFIEIWVLDPTDFTRYDLVCLFGSDYSSNPQFQAASSISGSPLQAGFAYQNNTFYRLVLHGGGAADLRASLCDDRGNELIGYDLGHTTAAYPHGFTIGLSQCINRPPTSAPTDVAVDYATVTTGDTTVAATTSPAIQLSWPTKAGAYYQIQSAATTRTSNWTNVGAPVLGTGGTMSSFEPLIKTALPVYQVVELP